MGDKLIELSVLQAGLNEMRNHLMQLCADMYHEGYEATLHNRAVPNETISEWVTRLTAVIR